MSSEKRYGCQFSHVCLCLSRAHGSQPSAQVPNTPSPVVAVGTQVLGCRRGTVRSLHLVPTGATPPPPQALNRNSSFT
uniref:Uncharacterized protein n=1 Tax=Oryza sativa subsp. japonica TaxID=39947 RepID=Q6Z350_ORYSJ|nr:hypothetical protein [Oryza sativa Japonica Group]